MHVELSGELEQLVAEKVATGRYGSSGEVLRQALELLQRQDAEIESFSADARAGIEEGWEALRRGENVDGETFFAELERVESVLRKRAGQGGS